MLEPGGRGVLDRSVEPGDDGVGEGAAGLVVRLVTLVPDIAEPVIGRAFSRDPLAHPGYACRLLFRALLCDDGCPEIRVG